MKQNPPKRECASCRKSAIADWFCDEGFNSTDIHEYATGYDGTAELCVVRDPDTGHIIYRGYLCPDHQDAYLTDGYKIDGAQ